MKLHPFIICLTALLGASLACSPASVVPGSLFKDNFSKSDSGWCVDSDTTSATDYKNGEYVFTVQSKNWFVWCNPGQKFDAIHVEVTAKNTGATDDTLYGLICHYQKSDDFYYLGITSKGHYTIGVYLNGKDKVLSENDSSAIKPDAASYLIGADCGSGSLALYVDGQPVGSASDSSYTSGDVGLFASSGTRVPAEVHFDDIAVSRLGSGK